MIARQIEIIKDFSKKFEDNIEDYEAFNILTLQYLCYKNEDLSRFWLDIKDSITDGSNDGGIDYVYFDEDENKVIIGQNKYSENISADDVAHETRKIVNTLENFYSGNTGSYSSKLKQVLQDSLDRLPDESQGNIDIYISSKKSISEETITSKTKTDIMKINSLNYFSFDELNEVVEKVITHFDTVEEFSLELDEAQNALTYNSGNQEGIIVNVSSKSLSKLYNKFHNKGLFNLNIRKFIRNKNVDDGIKETLEKKREDFWFLNNGLTIACDDYYHDGFTIKLYNFSIVNGGQTTSLIGNYKGKNEEEFYLTCKIVKSSDKLTDRKKHDFFNRIAEATNSQKPINVVDLRSNAREMIYLKTLLEKKGIEFTIKRGEKRLKKEHRIKNDVFAQITFSFVNQKPGTARSSKRSLFENNKSYNSIFKIDFNPENIFAFTTDIIRLNTRYDNIAESIKKNPLKFFNADQANVFKNGKMVIFALFGLTYQIINEDITIEQLNLGDRVSVEGFTKGEFISKYTEDDIDEKLTNLIQLLVSIVEQEYRKQFNLENTSSVSNFLKTDSNYNNIIVPAFVDTISRGMWLKELKNYGSIFLR